jgi:hypothetical protein
MEENRKNVLNAFFAILSVALLRERQVRLLCNAKWRKNVKYWTSEVITKKIKFIISLCGLRTIMYMYNRGFYISDAITRIAGQIIINRGMQNLPRVQQLMLQYRGINGK